MPRRLALVKPAIGKPSHFNGDAEDGGGRLRGDSPSARAAAHPRGLSAAVDSPLGAA